MKTISNGYEVITYTGERRLNPGDIKSIFPTEYDFLTAQFGTDFYNHLISSSNLVSYSGTDDWEAGSYNLNDKVVYEGFVYIASQNTTHEPTINEDNHWALAPKFSKTCLESLWCDNGLKEALTFEILRRNAPRLRTKLTQVGTVNLTAEDAEKASKKEHDSLMMQFARDRDIYLEVAKKYMTDYDEADKADCFKLYTDTLKSEDCEEAKNPSLHNEYPWVL